LFAYKNFYGGPLNRERMVAVKMHLYFYPQLYVAKGGFIVW